jgi:hypothetical protein
VKLAERRPPRRGQEGVALAIALLAIFLVALALSLLSLALLVRLRTVREESQGVVLGALSDAALAEALAFLAADGGFTGTGEHAFGSGKIGSQVASLTSTTYRVTATARLGVRVREVEAEVLRTPTLVQVTSWRLVPRARGS